ncbi:MAG: DNA repair protein RecN [Trueperaceae bacterium]|nr:DNA repair protein RecN [Trueperaceae bacterium]
MLRTIELRDFAIADDVVVEVGPGLNVLTGETGAGKSLVVDALALLVGGRADASVVRAGRPHALVQATWSSGTTFARRVAHEERNVARIDGEVVTVAELRQALVGRVGIFGQHAYRTLLDGGEQRALLDRGLTPAAQEAARRYRAAWQEREEVRTALAALRADARDRDRRLDLLRYQLDEIDAAHLVAGEDERLDARLRAARHVERVREGLGAGLGALAADEVGAADRVAEGVRALASAARFDAALEGLVADLGAAQTAVHAVVGELEAALEGLEADPAELERLEARRHLIDGLCRKYGADVDAVLAFRLALADELARLGEAEADDATLSAREAALDDVLTNEAALLGVGRREAAERLAPAVSEVVRTLALPHARFEVALEARDALGPHGAERVAFRFGANRGEPTGPLRDVASGGELSRVMLALHAAAGSDVPTLVFDEVDAGLGGRTGRAVGRVLKRLATGRQVLVVTHLAQVAAYADRHVRVEKVEQGGRTVTRVATLEGAAREAELARMLAGDDGAVALEHARTLLAEATADAT